MSEYKPYFRKHWIQRRVLAFILLLGFPIFITVWLWIDGWSDIKLQAKQLIGALLDGKHKEQE